MIFGKTDKEKAKRRAYGVKKYAWLPTVLENGQRIWLQSYYQFWWAHMYSSNLWSIDNGWYQNHLEWDKKHIGIGPVGFGDPSSVRTATIEQLLHEFGDSGPK